MTNVLNNVLFILIWASLFILVNVAVTIITITILYYVHYFAKTYMVEGDLRFRIFYKGIFALTREHVLSRSRSLPHMIGQFFEPLKKDIIWILIVSLIITVPLYVGLDMRFAEAVPKNRFPMHMLVTELLHERGPNYSEAGAEFENLIQTYDKILERGFEKKTYVNTLVRLLYPSDGPREQLEEIRLNLEHAGKEAKQEAIWQAGLATYKFHKHNYSSAHSPWTWFKLEVVRGEVRNDDLNSALEEFHNDFDNLRKAQTPSIAAMKARDACKHSRTFILLLSLVSDYDNAKLEHFRSELERASELSLHFAEKAKNIDDLNSTILHERAINMGYRHEVVQAILHDDMDKVHIVLNEANKKLLAEKTNLAKPES